MRLFILFVVVLLWPVMVLAQTPDQDILQLVTDSQAAQKALGLLGMAGAIVYGLVRLYRAAWCQALATKISPKLSWETWPRGVKVGVVFGAAFVLALCTFLAEADAITLSVVLSGLGIGFGAGVTALGADQAISGVTKRAEVSEPKAPAA